MSEGLNNINMAIQQAQKEYDSLIEELKGYDKIKLKLSQLEAFITTGKTLLGNDVPSKDNAKISTYPSLFPDEQQPLTHLESVKKILSDAGTELSLSDLVDGYRKRKWKLSESNGREVLRGIMLRNSADFKKTMKKNVSYYALATQGA
jgi:uncharacterized protein YihD (DUF1040 family)